VSGRILALDVGKKRIGLAVSDEMGWTAQGLDTLERTRIRDDLTRLKELAEQWNIETLLVGEPLHMSGETSRQSQYTREFAERLKEHLSLPVIFWDERLTSVEAERVLRETTVPVLVTPGTDGGPERLEDVRQAVRRVLVPVDLTAATRHQLEVARGVSQLIPCDSVVVVQPDIERSTVTPLVRLIGGVELPLRKTR